ncbi:MAG: hypothetical protein ACR2L5_01575 [Candidatus Actinomarinaceae bacterium]
MFKIENEKELTALLKIISEEAVQHSKKKLSEDSFDSSYQQLRSKEKNMFKEAEEVEETEQGTEEKPDKQNTSKESEVSSDSSTKPSEEKFVGSKDRLVDFVNDLRSAPSLKDSAVDEQVSAYYDRLSEEERNVLVFFLRELSRVMTGKASGEEARDPSDPPLSIKFISDAPEEIEQPAKQQASVDDDNLDDTSKEPEAPASEEEEDTSPPIKVNENQDHTILRQKIRNLFEN